MEFTELSSNIIAKHLFNILLAISLMLVFSLRKNEVNKLLNYYPTLPTCSAIFLSSCAILYISHMIAVGLVFGSAWIYDEYGSSLLLSLDFEFETKQAAERLIPSLMKIFTEVFPIAIVTALATRGALSLLKFTSNVF